MKWRKGWVKRVLWNHGEASLMSKPEKQNDGTRRIEPTKIVFVCVPKANWPASSEQQKRKTATEPPKRQPQFTNVTGSEGGSWRERSGTVVGQYSKISKRARGKNRVDNRPIGGPIQAYWEIQTQNEMPG